MGRKYVENEKTFYLSVFSGVTVHLQFKTYIETRLLETMQPTALLVGSLDLITLAHLMAGGRNQLKRYLLDHIGGYFVSNQTNGNHIDSFYVPYYIYFPVTRHLELLLIKYRTTVFC
jgi:hypothetical protein